MPDSIKICGTTVTIGDKVICLGNIDGWLLESDARLEGFILGLVAVGYQCITSEEDDCKELVYSLKTPEVSVIS
jgi:hypothetical protein